MQGVTGLATIDKPWLKYYNLEKPVIDPTRIKNKTVWDVVEEFLDEEKEIPAVEYFGRIISRKEFKEYVIKWAKGLKALGVGKGDYISLYVPAAPESFAVFLAANAIGAIPYYQKLVISKEALQEETKEARISVVFDMMWPNVKDVFSEERFEHIIVTSVSDSMNDYTGQFSSQDSNAGDNGNMIPDEERFIRTKQVLKLGEDYEGEYRVPYSPNEIAIITTSSGTTSNEVKGTIDTNEGVLCSVVSFINTGLRFTRGKRTLTCFPPTASTSMNCLQLTPILTGGTIIFDPRADVNIWYEQIMQYKPDLAITTGPVWEKFARDVESVNKKGNRVDLTWADSFIIGGAGTTPGILKYINNVLRNNGLEFDVYAGYGYSEVFGPLSVAKREEDNTSDLPVINIGLPVPGSEVGIFDEYGNELPYGKGYRGELWSRSPANMHGYYGKPELTKTIIIDGWIHSGDLCEIDENGCIYCYGRIKNSIEINGEKIYLFDISIDIREKFSLHDVFTEVKKLTDGTYAINMYFVQEQSVKTESETLMVELDKYLANKKIYIHGYKEYEDMLPIEPSTLKNRTKETSGFVKYIAGKKYGISYEEAEREIYKENRIAQ